MTPTLRLKCRLCDWLPDEPTVLEAVRLHFNVTHDTDDVELELVAICPDDAAVMNFTGTDEHPGAPFEVDRFECPSCGQAGTVLRRKTA